MLGHMQLQRWRVHYLWRQRGMDLIRQAQLLGVFQVLRAQQARIAVAAHRVAESHDLNRRRWPRKEIPDQNLEVGQGAWQRPGCRGAPCSSLFFCGLSVRSTGKVRLCARRWLRQLSLQLSTVRLMQVLPVRDSNDKAAVNVTCFSATDDLTCIAVGLENGVVSPAASSGTAC